MAHFATDQESLERVRSEFDALNNDKSLSIEEALKKNLTLENSSELTYMNCVLQEALRLNPSASVTSPYHFEKDTKVGSIVVKAYDTININIYGVHTNGSYW